MKTHFGENGLVLDLAALPVVEEVRLTPEFATTQTRSSSPALVLTRKLMFATLSHVLVVNCQKSWNTFKIFYLDVFDDPVIAFCSICCAKRCPGFFVLQCKPLNVITLGQVQTDNINRMIIITESSCT